MRTNIEQEVPDGESGDRREEAREFSGLFVAVSRNSERRDLRRADAQCRVRSQLIPASGKRIPKTKARALAAMTLSPVIVPSIIRRGCLFPLGGGGGLACAPDHTAGAPV